MRSAPRSISRKLMWMNIMVSAIVLVLAVLAFFFYDVISFRQNLIRDLRTAAQIVGANSITALMFDDQQSAATTLEALRNSPDVVAATLVANDGATFAEYQRATNVPAPAAMPLAAGKIDQEWVNGSGVLLAHRIIFQGKPVGTVYIAAQLTETGKRARQYLAIAFAVLLICMAAGILISATARRLVARPMVALAETARRVSRERDYSVRAEPQMDGDEVAVLVEAFNEMLVQIQERDTALNHARGELELRVEQRTAALRAANRELEAFSYMVAHDLRGPLDAVQGMIYLLETSNREKQQGEGEIFEQMRQVTHGMTSLIDDLLHLSRASTAPLKKESVDLTSVVARIGEDLKRGDPTRRVEFMIAHVPPVQADEGLMRVALDNLIRNSWKYSSHHETACIEFGAINRRGETLYYVRDDGAGFDPKQSDELFQPFHRLHNRNEFPGTGIGLATVQRILARHGGRIWAEGAVEKGATFWFTLRGTGAAG
jgi:signal transduction histidine kinase